MCLPKKKGAQDKMNSKPQKCYVWTVLKDVVNTINQSFGGDFRDLWIEV